MEDICLLSQAVVHRASFKWSSWTNIWD